MVTMHVRELNAGGEDSSGKAQVAERAAVSPLVAQRCKQHEGAKRERDEAVGIVQASPSRRHEEAREEEEQTCGAKQQQEHQQCRAATRAAAK